MTDTFALPSSYTWGYVTGRVIYAIADTAEDVDDKPQARAALGKVSFINNSSGQKVTDLDYPAIVMNGRVTTILDNLGRVVDGEGRLGIWLITGTYRVEFTLSPASDGNQGTLVPFYIVVTSAHTVASPLDLAAYAPESIPAGSPVTTLVVPPGSGILVRDAITGAISWADPSTGVSPPATTTTTGTVTLAGDLGGTAGAPTVPGLVALAAGIAVLATHTAFRTGTIVGFGDSIMAGSDQEAGFNGGNNAYYRDSILDFACGLSGQRLHRLKNVAVPGNSTSQMLARFDTDVTPLAPSILLINGGTNDITTTISVGGGIADATALATFKANVQAIVGKARAIGAMPVLLTIAPSSEPARQPLIASWNAWLLGWCRTNSVPAVDAHQIWVDPATGGYATAAGSGDGVHPGPPGYLAAGQRIATTLAPLVSGDTLPVVIGDVSDSTNLLPGGLMLGTPNGLGIPSGWDQYSGLAGVVVSTVTDAAIPGKMLRLACTGTGGWAVVYKSLGSGFAVGDVLEIAGVLTSSGGVLATLQVACIGGGHNAIPAEMTAALTRYTALARFAVPVGTTSIEVYLQAGAGTGTVDFGQVTLRNLTALGIA